ncbi:MAG: glycosyltransferase family 39 protein [Chloroflexi bacterium]|nr:glycosyltransferase family 39 protein [Chloroflexota bacterium]
MADRCVVSQGTTGAKGRSGARSMGVLALTLLAFALFMWRIDARSIWWDESLSLYRAQQDVAYILSNRIDFAGIRTVDQHPPLYFLLLHAVIRLAGESDLVLRFPSAVAATLLVSLLYAVGRRLHSPRVGSLAALLGALSPFYLWYAQEARMYTLVALLALLAFYCLWRELDGGGWPWLGGFVLAALAGIASHYLFVLTLPANGMLLVSSWYRRHAERGPADAPCAAKMRPLSRWWLFPLLLVALILAGHRVLALLPALRSSREYVPLDVMMVDVLNSFNLGLSVNLRQVWPLDILLVALFVLGVLALYRRARRPSSPLAQSRDRAGLILLLGLGLFPILMLWGLSFLVPLYTNSRYAIIGSSAYYVGMAFGLEAWLRWRRLPGAVMLLVVIAGMGLSIGRYQFHEHYQRKEEYRGIAQLIAENERVGDVIVVAGPESVPALKHYYKGPLPILGVPEGGWTEERLERELGRIAYAYDRIWFVRGRVQLSDPQERVRRWMGKETLELLHRGYPSSGAYLAVEARLGRSPLQDQERGAEARGRFGESLAVTDYAVRYWDSRGEAQQITAAQAAGLLAERLPLAAMGVPAGKVVSVRVDTRVLRPLANYKVSMRLVRDGIVWAQRDREPFMYYPTTQWPPGRVVRWEADVQVPYGTPPGFYELQLWLYEAQSGEPLSFIDAAAGPLPCWSLGLVPIDWPVGPLPRDDLLPSGVRRVWWPPKFAGQLDLEAWHLSPTMVKAGEGLVVRLFWRVKRPIHTDYRVVLNWQDQSGVVWRTTEHPPCGTELGTSLWKSGQMVSGIFYIPIPDDAPSGRHTLHLLLYDPIRGRFSPLSRGPILWAGRDVVLGEIEIAGKMPAP